MYLSKFYQSSVFWVSSSTQVYLHGQQTDESEPNLADPNTVRLKMTNIWYYEMQYYTKLFDCAQGEDWK